MKELVVSTKDILLRGAHEISEKGYADYVTDADIAVQNLITSKINEKYPDIAVVSEENQKQGLDNKCFILDPIDGTTNFKYGLGFFGVSLAYCVDQKIECGVVYEPYRDELFYAVNGKGAFLNGNRIMVNTQKQLKHCLISVGTSPYQRDNTHKRFSLFEKIFDSCIDIRRLGAASLDICYTACGRIDGFFEDGLHIWDYAAAMIILHEAGGKITDNMGNMIDLNNIKSDIVAGNSEINKQLINIIGG
jgi:myo-inositol-1(or 4)-monophosphatase